MNLCSRNSPYSLNCHVGAMLVFRMLCRITQSSDAYRNESVSVMDHEQTMGANSRVLDQTRPRPRPSKILSRPRLLISGPRPKPRPRRSRPRPRHFSRPYIKVHCVFQGYHDDSQFNSRTYSLTTGVLDHHKCSLIAIVNDKIGVSLTSKRRN